MTMGSTEGLLAAAKIARNEKPPCANATTTEGSEHREHEQLPHAWRHIHTAFDLKGRVARAPRTAWA